MLFSYLLSRILKYKTDIQPGWWIRRHRPSAEWRCRRRSSRTRGRRFLEQRRRARWTQNYPSGCWSRPKSCKMVISNRRKWLCVWSIEKMSVNKTCAPFHFSVPGIWPGQQGSRDGWCEQRVCQTAAWWPFGSWPKNTRSFYNFLFYFNQTWSFPNITNLQPSS